MVAVHLNRTQTTGNVFNTPASGVYVLYAAAAAGDDNVCLLYTSPSPRDS